MSTRWGLDSNNFSQQSHRENEKETSEVGCRTSDKKEKK